MTNAFFTELARCLRKQGIDSAIQKDSRLEVFLHGQPALFVSPKNEVFLLPEMSGNDEAGDLYHEVAQISDEVFSYVEAVQSAAHLKANGLSEDFRLLADFGGAVLAGREREPGWGYDRSPGSDRYERPHQSDLLLSANNGHHRLLRLGSRWPGPLHEYPRWLCQRSGVGGSGWYGNCHPAH